MCRVQKCTPHPGQHARDITPEPRGEAYHYCVDKFWIVEDVSPDGQVLIRTRRGKQRRVDPADPQFRHATWWERLRYASRFPSLDEPAACPLSPKLHHGS